MNVEGLSRGADRRRPAKSSVSEESDDWTWPAGIDDHRVGWRRVIGAVIEVHDGSIADRSGGIVVQRDAEFEAGGRP